MDKRIIGAVVVILLLVSAGVFAQTEADFIVTLTEDGTGAKITKYTGTAVAVRIPATIQGMPVKEIGDGSSRVVGDNITSVTFPDGLDKIGNNAFYGCTKLTALTLPSTITKIGGGAFSGCTILTNVVIPDRVSEIGNGAFESSGFISVTLPKSLSKAGNGIFYNCKNLKTVILPEGITIIGPSMFAGCTALTAIALPSTLAEIGSGAFGNTGLTTITIPNNVVKLGEGAFIGCPLTTFNWSTGLISIPKETFRNCTKLISIVVSEGVSEIEGGSFSGCTAMTSLTLPSTITKVGDYAFAGCTALTTVTAPDSVHYISLSNNSFNNCPQIALSSQALLKRVGTLAFPSGFIGTWKRDKYNNTLTFTASTLKANNQPSAWNLQNISGDVYTIRYPSMFGSTATLVFRLSNGNIELSGDSGNDQDNWNGIWKKQ